MLKVMPARYRSRTVIMSLQTIKEGHLYKKGKINKDWRQRLFVLNGKRLSYFKGGVSVYKTSSVLIALVVDV